MDDDEAALLAELRAISSRSASTRFQDEVDHVSSPLSSEPCADSFNEQTNDVGNALLSKENQVPIAQEPSSHEHDNVIKTTPRKISGTGRQLLTSDLPPWKRKTTKDVVDPVTSDVVITTLIAPKEEGEVGTSTVKSLTAFAFQGERGGVAEDSDLLAELRAISSGCRSRFESGEPRLNEILSESADGAVELWPSTKSPDSGNGSLRDNPPWKRMVNKEICESEGSGVVAVASRAPTEEDSVDIMKPSKAFAFQGERGGVAEDADLLAELRAISGSGGSRFDSGESKPNEILTQSHDGLTKSPVTGNRGKTDVPPWKRRANKEVDELEISDVVDVAPRAPKNGDSVRIAERSSGGVVEDTDLLAEQSAISYGGGSHFESRESEQMEIPRERVEGSVGTKPSTKSPVSGNRCQDDVPPWKRTVNKEVVEPKASDDVSRALKEGDPVRIAEASTAFAFRGERGGVAEDADLLAELRAISDGSRSHFESREAEKINVPTERVDGAMVTKPLIKSPASGNRRKIDGTPSKLKANKDVGEPEKSDGIIEVAQAPKEGVSIRIAEPSVTFAFQGERGGMAEDADLLAELRAISGGGGSRFDSRESEQIQIPRERVDVSVRKKSLTKGPASGNRSQSDVPPWQRRTNKEVIEHKESKTLGVVARAPREEGNLGNAKESMAFTFQGERGGVAEDADLLAELRAISGVVGSRFVSGKPKQDEILIESIDGAVKTRTLTKGPASGNSSKTAVPPWKRKANEQDIKPKTSDAVVVNAVPKEEDSVNILKPSNAFAFQGERGGVAEDADLLAELKAISGRDERRFESGESQQNKLLTENIKLMTKPKTSSPFSGTHGRLTNTPLKLKSSNLKVEQEAHDVVVSPNQLMCDQPAPSSVMPEKHQGESLDIVITFESVKTCIADKDWKIRKQAFLFLHDALVKEAKRHDIEGSIDSQAMLPGLDDAVVAMVADSNAIALDFALQFAITFAENCSSATRADLASRIVTSLLKGNALSSSKASTVKHASSLALKLMEVGDPDSASVDGVVGVLLDVGVTSKKPKVVVSAISIIHNAALDFGASNLPLASIKASSRTILQHPNAVVRETGMKIIAEICRALGSKAPLQDLLASLKPAQLSQLNALLDNQPNAPVPRIGLRCRRTSNSLNKKMSTEDALSAFEAQSAEMEAKRFANRARVNIFVKLATTDYSSRISHSKWSEKVAALDLLLECGGETPYKLEQPGPTVNYIPLIGEMKKLLGHTHFAVASKSMQVLSMLAVGVGEKLYTNLRPFVSTLLQLGKDKKLTKGVASCLDSFFGPILSLEHLLDKDDSVPSQLDEKHQKNAVVRTIALEFLARCIRRSEDVGKRGQFAVQSINVLSLLAVEKLSDTDNKVRQAALNLLLTLIDMQDARLVEVVNSVIEELKSSNPRAYKSLSSTSSPLAIVSPSANRECPKLKASHPTPKMNQSLGNQGTHLAAKSPAPQNSTGKATVEAFVSTDYDASLARLYSLNIPNWSAAEDDGGILAGLKSGQWLHRQCAIQSLNSYCRSHERGEVLTSAVLNVVKQHTKAFRDANVNIMKSTFELFLTFCHLHTKACTPFPIWVCKDGVAASVEKLVDKKLSAVAISLLTEMCVMNPPSVVICASLEVMDRVKSPLVIEAYLKWFNTLLVDFGCQTLQLSVPEIIVFLDKHCQGTNLKVKSSSLLVVGELHRQYGPSFRALALSKVSQPSVRTQFEAAFVDAPFSPMAETVRPRKCVVTNGEPSKAVADTEECMRLEVPRLDLISEISKDCLSKMGSKEGKTAWKLRKEALDEVANALINCNGLLMTESAQLSSLHELLRALKERLADSQSNLKPIAARVIGSILAKVDKVSQGKLGKVILPSLVGAAMNDNRKPMRDESLEALKIGTKSNDLDGGEYHELSLEALVIAVVGELKDSEFKSAGISDVLLFVSSVSEHTPNLDSILMTRAQTLGQLFSTVMVNGLTSCKSETRAAAEKLIGAFIDQEKIDSKTVLKGLAHLKPAQQRTVAPIVHKAIGESIPRSPRMEKDSAQSEKRRPDHKSSTISTGDKESSRQIPRRLSSARFAPSAVESRVASTHVQAPPSQVVDLPGHPLMVAHAGGAFRGQRLGAKQVSWVEFPEEPTGTTLMSTLQSAWSQLIQKRAQLALFPDGGIKKQDDAKDGCEVIAQAIDFETRNCGDAIVQQLEFVLKWSAYTLCSRENPVGLYSLLSMLSDLVVFLGSRGYAFTDVEALALFPYVLEKTSNAKGRFRELFDDLLVKSKKLNVLPPKIYGAVVCATVYEKSANAKSRVLAYNECVECVGIVGLSGVGKRGLLVAARMVSDEKLPESRAAVLDLVLAILVKMDGDVDRLARLCSSHMSEKTRAHIEERWQKRHSKKDTSSDTSNTLSKIQGPGVVREQSLRMSRIPSSRASIAERRIALQGLTERNMVSHAQVGAIGEQERPRFQLGLEPIDSQPPNHSKPQIAQSLGPFTFNYNPNVQTVKSSPLGNPAGAALSTRIESDIGIDAVAETASSSSGAAAALRARLMKIRQKNTAKDSAVQLPDASQLRVRSSVTKADHRPPAIHIESSTNYASALVIFQEVIARPVAAEDDPDVMSCIWALKRFHTAISKNDDTIDRSLREDIQRDVPHCVERLTQVLTFAFDHGDKAENAGMCVPLLSAILATVMSLFRDTDLAPIVSQEALLTLIKATGRCLLDSRLAVTATHVSGLDESTSSQMVRGMNKLAVQAATGTARHTALLALMVLQGQMALDGSESPSEASFKGRMSRIALKLFGKVMKTEESLMTPYSSPFIDLTALFFALEEMLTIPPLDGPRHREARSMATALMTSILKFRSDTEIKTFINELHLTASTHGIWSIVKSLAPPIPSGVNQASMPASPSSRDVAHLVSAIGSACEGFERAAALNALRDYRQQHGDEDLTSHLGNVSEKFRDYIWEQLALPHKSPTGHPSRETLYLPMSERIRDLRSRLSTSDAAFVGERMPSPERPTPILELTPSKIPTPSRIPRKATDSVSRPTPALSLRERLAVAQANRMKTAAPVEVIVNDHDQLVPSSHAAALRARLQAVRNQTQTSD